MRKDKVFVAIYLSFIYTKETISLLYQATRTVREGWWMVMPKEIYFKPQTKHTIKEIY